MSRTLVYQLHIPGLAASVTVRVRAQVINLLLESEGASYSFDRSGRLIGAFVGGRNYRRGLDNRVLQKWSGPDGVRRRRWLPVGEAQALLHGIYALAGQVVRAGGTPHDLDVLSRWDGPSLQADAAQYARIYRPVSILPPDQYLALVLQATEGCSYNRCTFCDFYRDRRFRIKGDDEFKTHVQQVLAFFGPAAGLRKSVFLADANALVAPMRRIRGWLDVIETTESLSRLGIYSFIDAFDVHRKSLADWQELAGRGVRRIYIGMETGDDALLEFLQKPGHAADVLEAVQTLKAAGLAASVIVMTGIGGDRYAETHVAETIAALNAMPLSRGDIVYFSPFVDSPGSEYGRLAAAMGIRPLDTAEVAGQERAIRAGLRWPDPAGAPVLSRYDIREFVY